MIFVLVIDVVCNSSLEYDNYGTNVALFFGAQIFVQISVFIVLFLILCDTYPFRIGLLRELISEFRPVLYCHPVYMLYTMGLGAYRNVRARARALPSVSPSRTLLVMCVAVQMVVGDGFTTVMILWRSRSYASASVVHKLREC